jgi:hypothetical protein
MNREQACYRQPDELAEMFLQQYIWHPQEEELAWEYRDRKQAEYRLKWWRGVFYEWYKGRYTQVDDGEVEVLVTGYITGKILSAFGRKAQAYADSDEFVEATA